MLCLLLLVVHEQLFPGSKKPLQADCLVWLGSLSIPTLGQLPPGILPMLNPPCVRMHSLKFFLTVPVATKVRDARTAG